MAAQISLHDVFLIHGSRVNRSTKRRAGLTFRYMPASSYFNRSIPAYRTDTMHGLDVRDDGCNDRRECGCFRLSRIVDAQLPVRIRIWQSWRYIGPGLHFGYMSISAATVT